MWDPVRERIREGAGRIRNAGSDYLAYRLIDAIVDHYFVVLEKIGDEIESLTDEVSDEPSSRDATEDSRARESEMIFLRKLIWPTREVAGVLERAESALIKKPTVVYLRDVYDHYRSVDRGDGILPGPRLGDARSLPLDGEQPAERRDEDPHHLRHDLRPAHFSRGRSTG